MKAMTIKQTISGVLSQSWFARFALIVMLAGAFICLAIRFWQSDSFWHREEYAAMSGVVVACAGEYVADFKPFRNWPKHRKTFAKGSTLLLIISLAFELLGLMRTSQISDEKLGVAIQIGADATTRAAELDGKAAQLNNENIRLQANLDRQFQINVNENSESSVRDILWPSPVQNLLKEDLKKLPKDNIAIEYIRDNGESWNLAGEFLDLLIQVDRPPRGYPNADGFPHPVSSAGQRPLIGLYLVIGNKVSDKDVETLLRDFAYTTMSSEMLSEMWSEPHGQNRLIIHSGFNDDWVTIICGINPHFGPQSTGWWERIMQMESAITRPSSRP